MQWTAEWIWHPRLEMMDNLYVCARREFDLTDVPADTCVLITAGSLYKLHINGEFVGMGPNPSDPSRYYYDVYPVAHLLRSGVNTVAVLAYNYGAVSKGIVGQNGGRGGLLVEVRPSRDGDALLATDASWRVLQAPEWEQDVPVNCTLYGDYKEVQDTRRTLDGWMLPGFDDSCWRQPEVLGPPPIGPYTRLVEREIPFLGGEPVHPVNVWWESASVTYAWRDDWEVYHEHRLIPGSPFETTAKPVEIRKTHDDFAPSILLDYGRIVTGYPEIVVADGSGGVVDVLYGETLHLVRVDRFVLRGGRQVLKPFNRRTFRYMKLLFAEMPGGILLDTVRMAMNTYPVEPRGAFACSDSRLNRIWEVGRETMRLSMLDHFVDCPWRERTIYGGDVYNENLIAHYAFGDPRLNRKTLRQMFALQYDDGGIPPYGPYRHEEAGFYPSWAGFTGLAFLDHYELTADRDFLEELWPAFERLLEWTVREVAGNTPHLIGRPAGGGTYAQWRAAPKTEFAAWDNFPFLLLLRRAAARARDAGRPRIADHCEEAAALLTRDLRRCLLDARRLCVPWTEPPETALIRPARADAAYLLWSGMLAVGDGKQCAAAAFDADVAPLATPFHALLLADGLFAYDEDRRALDFIRSYYGDMLDRGATTFWEHFSTAWPRGLSIGFGGSLCHGWSAGPTYTLPARVLGVRPAAPGFARVRVEPRPADLTWAEGTVPTPHGEVAVGWKRTDDEFRLTVRLPSGCAGADVSLPPPLGPRPTVTLDGHDVTFTFEGARPTLDVPPGEHTVTCRTG